MWQLTTLDATQIHQLAVGARTLTRRQVLSMVMGLYDPLGLVSPALLHGKLLLRRLYRVQATTGWDADLPAGKKKLWAAWYQSLLDPTEAMFPRSMKPPGAVGSPRLVGFGDTSMVALCVVLYVVWGDSQGRNHSRILTGRCRVAPLLWTTIPRGELQALVVLHRLTLSSKHSL